eukprot:359401-Chlamydomonas_euryale.AAC.4
MENAQRRGLDTHASKAAVASFEALFCHGSGLNLKPCKPIQHVSNVAWFRVMAPRHAYAHRTSVGCLSSSYIYIGFPINFSTHTPEDTARTPSFVRAVLDTRPTVYRPATRAFPSPTLDAAVTQCGSEPQSSRA